MHSTKLLVLRNETFCRPTDRKQVLAPRKRRSIDQSLISWYFSKSCKIQKMIEKVAVNLCVCVASKYSNIGYLILMEKIFRHFTCLAYPRSFYIISPQTAVLQKMNLIPLFPYYVLLLMGRIAQSDWYLLLLIRGLPVLVCAFPCQTCNLYRLYACDDKWR